MSDEAELERRVRELERDNNTNSILLQQHVQSCDRRNALILKVVMWVAFGVFIAIVEQTFNIHIPTNVPAI